ncbi:hypothetical protein AGMMS4956_10110 [Bacteroidia bacterium]|nr:hypothetical protein AGMMS4956_10110 [Bacteroidia bacterium]
MYAVAQNQGWDDDPVPTPQATSQAQASNIDPAISSRLPKAGDFALGIDATPFLSYLGNIFSSGGNTAPSFDGVDNTIYGKYFLKDNAAIRAKLHLQFEQSKYKQTVPDDYVAIADPTNTEATAVDVRKDITNGVALQLGYEWRRGKGKVQGFCGGELLIGYLHEKEVYDYANAITAANQSPSTGFITYPNIGERIVENKWGGVFSVGLGAFVGVEYFFAPQISIGGEFGLGVIYRIRGQDEITSEGILAGDRHEWKYRERYGGAEAFLLGLSTSTSGSIFLLFHF